MQHSLEWKGASVLASYSKISLAVLLLLMAGSCATQSGSSSNDPANLISNPFNSFESPTAERSSNVKFRTTHGDASYEVEVPNTANSDLEMPFAENGRRGRNPASMGEIDYQYSNAKPTMGDREIVSTFAKAGNTETEDKRAALEQEMGLQGSDEPGRIDQSYLAKIDVVKQLFKAARYEAALIELDRMIQDQPNNSRLYEMRGTVLDRLGYADLAVKSWRQALEFDPNRAGLKKLVEKREQQRSVASERGKK